MYGGEIFCEDYELSEAELIALASRDLISKLRTLNEKIEEAIYFNKYHQHDLTREKIERFNAELSTLIRSYS